MWTFFRAGWKNALFAIEGYDLADDLAVWTAVEFSVFEAVDTDGASNVVLFFDLRRGHVEIDYFFGRLDFGAFLE